MGGVLPLLLVLLGALLFQCRPVAVAAGLLMFLQLTGFTGLSAVVGRWGPPAGWALLTAAVLAPLATGSAPLSLTPLFSPLGLGVFVAGLVGTYLTQRGMLFLRLHPDLILALSLGFLAALFWSSPPWPALAPGQLARALPPVTLNEGRVVGGMALLRAVSGLIEVTAAFLMLRAGRVGPALQLNASLGLIGPAVNLLVCALGLVFVAVRFSFWRTGLVALGVVFIWLGTR